METLSQKISACKSDLCHSCDGPLTPFVLISRATEWAMKNQAMPMARDSVCGSYDAATIAANALDEALTERGWLSDGMIVTGS